MAPSPMVLGFVPQDDQHRDAAGPPDHASSALEFLVLHSSQSETAGNDSP